MEENRRQEIPPASPDLAATEGCRSGLTRTDSDSSALTVDLSNDFIHLNRNAKPGQSTEWTDEKHSLYIDSLETSFVNQLHHSMGLLGCRSQEKNSSRQLPANTRNSSGKFMVLRDGCWQKINFERNKPLLDTAVDSHAILGSPWIRHFRSTSKCRTVASPDLQEHSALCMEGIRLRGKMTSSHGLATTSEQHPIRHVRHHDSVGSITEVSDQNFVDEVEGEKLSSLSMAKRLKTAAADASSKDQVVPFGKFHKT